MDCFVGICSIDAAAGLDLDVQAYRRSLALPQIDMLSQE